MKHLTVDPETADLFVDTRIAILFISQEMMSHRSKMCSDLMGFSGEKLCLGMTDLLTFGQGIGCYGADAGFDGNCIFCSPLLFQDGNFIVFGILDQPAGKD